MSGSDLAPFVGAVLRDRIIDEMQNQIDVLQSRQTESENERLLVQITGTNGTPIHYEESFRKAKRCNYYNADRTYNVVGISLRFANDGRSDDLTTNGFPLTSLNELEIRLGGVVVQRFNADDLSIHFQNDPYDDNNHQMKFATLKRNCSGPITCVRGRFGPLPLGWGQELVGREMLLTDFFELVPDENNGLTPQTLVVIHELKFDEKDITGIMSLINEETRYTRV